MNVDNDFIRWVVKLGDMERPMSIIEIENGLRFELKLSLDTHLL